MEEDSRIVSNLLLQNDIKIDKLFGNANILDINSHIYKEILSILMLKKDSVLNLNIKGEKNKLVEIENNVRDGLPSELNVPKFRYQILTENNLYLFFKKYSKKSLKEIIDESEDGLEEQLILKYYYYLIQQIEVLHNSGFIHGCLDSSFILPFSNDNGLIILDAIKSSMEIVDVERKVKKRKTVKKSKNSCPEVILNSRSPSKEDDYWSIGMILVEMCLGDTSLDINEYNVITKEKTTKLLKERNYSSLIIEIITTLLINRSFLKEKTLINHHKFRETTFQKDRLAVSETEGIKFKRWKIVQESSIEANKRMKLCKLKNIFLKNNKIGDVGCKAIFSNAKYLRDLEKLYLESIVNKVIVGCGISSESSNAINENLSYLKKLKEISLSWNKIENDGCTAIFNNAKYLRCLEILRLFNCGLTPEFCKMINLNMKYLEKLKSLILTGHEGCKVIFNNAKYLLNLEILHLESNGITSKSYKVINVNMKYFINLKLLNLSYNLALKDEIVKAILNSSKYLTNLEKLDLHNCGVTSESSKVIDINMKYLKQLKEINLSNNYDFGDGGCKAILNNCKYLTNLEKLSLGGNNIQIMIKGCGITDVSLPTFIENFKYQTKLIKLELKRNYLSGEVIKETFKHIKGNLEI